MANELDVDIEVVDAPPEDSELYYFPPSSFGLPLLTLLLETQQTLVKATLQRQC